MTDVAWSYGRSATKGSYWSYGQSKIFEEYEAPSVGGQPMMKRWGGIPFMKGQRFGAKVW